MSRGREARVDACPYGPARNAGDGVDIERVNESLLFSGVYGKFRRDPSFFRPDAERYHVTLKYEY